MSDDEPARRVNPDPYPSGIYSTLSYPSPPERRVPLLTEYAAKGDPPNGSRPADPEVLARIGDVDVTATTIRTPAGEIPLAGATVEVVDERVVRTPTWAVVCAIVGFFVVPVLSLLFLLVRESVPTGDARVTIAGGHLRHETVVVDPAEVELARSLAAS
jgi:hypothetical protein